MFFRDNSGVIQDLFSLNKWYESLLDERKSYSRIMHQTSVIALGMVINFFVTGHRDLSTRYWKLAHTNGSSVISALIALAIVPVVGALVFHTKDTLALWLGSDLTEIGETTRYIPGIALGTMLNVLMMLPFNLQLAHGWSGLSARKNLILLPIFIAVLWYGIPQWGPITGVWKWLGVDLTNYMIEVPLMHARILQTTLWNWWLWDTALPCISGLFLFWVTSACLVGLAAIPPLIACILSMALVAVFLLVLLPAGRWIALNIWDRATTVKPI